MQRRARCRVYGYTNSVERFKRRSAAGPNFLACLECNEIGNIAFSNFRSLVLKFKVLPMQAQRPGDILVVDSDGVFTSGLSPVLSACGHTVTVCRTAAEARYELDRFSFDVVLCARHLPDGEGQQLCHELKSSTEGSITPVGLLVSGAREIDEIMYRPSGMVAKRQIERVPPDEYLSRYLPLDEMPARVQTLMRIGRYQEEIANSIGTLMKVAEGIEEQDKRMTGHCKRLSIMAVELGAVLGCDEFQLTALERAGYLHDIGKVAIPGAVISKSERLSPREMEIIQAHCVLGERLCADVAALKPVLPIIRHHHERADGTGYPDRLRGQEIPVLAQILSIPDIYDALRMWRPYRPPMNEAQAIDLLRQEVSRGYWNRLIFDAFIDQVLPGLDERLNSAHVLWPAI
ncbi:MAG: cyclic di-GMP phosphodiesterase [Abditibacteriota bacterium]|nr:cyclic di-GMP phosphodiesterase [Abditibacteriota bacterium]